MADHTRPASFGTESRPEPRFGGSFIYTWIDEPEVRLVLSMDVCTMPIIEFSGSGKSVQIGLDGPGTRGQIRAALDELDRRDRIAAALKSVRTYGDEK